MSVRRIPDEVLQHVWATGAAEQLLTLLRGKIDLDADRDGRGTIRSHLHALRSEIDLALRDEIL